MLANLPKWVPFAVGAVFMVIALAYWFFTRGDDEDEDEDEEFGPDGQTIKMSGAHGAETMELDERTARKSRMIALKDSLEKSLQTRAGVKSASADRLAMPWFMLVGTEGSGKKSLLANTGLPLPYGPPVELDHDKKDGGRWWMFEDAVVVEAPTIKPVAKAAAPSEVTAAEPAVVLDLSESWNNLLGLLQRERPDSPLNGIVVAVSCGDLSGSRRKSPEEMAEQAALLRAFMEKTRRVLGVRLPVHLLVTKCDIIPGFRSFTETLPEARRNDIFGWSNPHTLDKPFDPAWAQAGVAEVQKSLETLHDELLAAPETVHDADGLFVFVNEFAEVQDPLVDFITKLFPAGERRPSFFFRGFSFTGDASESAARAAARADDDAATLHISMEAADAESHSLVFMQSLFADKIFTEAGLARTASRVKISRDKRVVLAQVAAILIIALGVFGMWTALNGVSIGSGPPRPGLRAEARELTLTLVGASIDLDELKRPENTAQADSELTRRTQDAALLNVIAEMGSVSSSRLRSVFIPSSWVSRLPSSIEASTQQGLQLIVLPVIRARLQERVNRFLGTPGRAGRSDNELDRSDPKSLATYLEDVKELNRNIERFNSVAKQDTGQVADLLEVVDYLFGERPADSSVASPDFARALRAAESQPITLTPQQSRAAVSRAVDLVIAVSDSAARQLAPSGAVRGNDLRALRRLKALSDLVDPKTGLVATVSDSMIAGQRLAKIVQDSVTKYLNEAAVRVLKDPLLPDAAGLRLRTVLTAIFNYRLMDPLENRTIKDELPAGQKLRWDPGSLELALSLRPEMRRALATTSDAFSTQTQTRLRAAMENQVRDRIIDVAAGSQRFTPDSLSAGVIKAEADNLDLASPRLLHVAALLDSLDAGEEGRNIVAAATRQAEHVLALAQSAVDSARYLTPKPEVITQWRGGTPVGFAALGVTDEPTRDVSLRDHSNALGQLSVEIVPALRYLALPAVKAEIRAKKLQADWIAITASLAAYQGGDVKSTRFTFEQFVVSTMSAIDVASCQRAAAATDTVRAAPDFFVRRRTSFRAALIGRCGAKGADDAVAAYERMRTLFTAKLAGRFPFVDSAAAAAAPDADPAAVREFYGLYDAFARFNDIALRSDQRFRPSAAPVFVFLDQVAEMRAFFSPFIDSAAVRKAPEYAFAVDPIATGTPGEYRLETGERSLVLNDSLHSGIWGFGESVKIRATGAAEPAAKFTSTGWWSLVELAMLQRETKVRIYHPDTMIELKLPVFPKVAPPLQPPAATRPATARP